MKTYFKISLIIYVPYGPPWMPSQAFLNRHSLPARRNWQMRSVALDPQRKQREGRGYDALRATKLGQRQHVSHTPLGLVGRRAAGAFSTFRLFGRLPPYAQHCDDCALRSRAVRRRNDFCLSLRHSMLSRLRASSGSRRPRRGGRQGFRQTKLAQFGGDHRADTECVL
jgi:hypothetical protein